MKRCSESAACGRSGTTCGGTDTSTASHPAGDCRLASCCLSNIEQARDISQQTQYARAPDTVMLRLRLPSGRMKSAWTSCAVALTAEGKLFAFEFLMGFTSSKGVQQPRSFAA